MKRRYTPIIAITAAFVLIGSLAYALDKKKQAKPTEGLSDTVHEEEALRAELLAATEEHQKKPVSVDKSKSRKVAVMKTRTDVGEPKASK